MKRGSTDHCLVLGVNKPSGMTSHDVVNRVRRIFGERRVGHTGTLDPLADGVLPVCVGPATRLNPYLTGHDKRYVVRIAFGVGTDTDDAEGSILKTAPVPDEIADPAFAERFVASLAGSRKQLPPAYSAVKVNGKKSYEAARGGTIIDLTPRDIVVHEARLVSVGRGYAAPKAPSPCRKEAEGATAAFEGEAAGVPADAAVASSGDEILDLPWWDVEFFVSKGTYIRSLARDAGIALGCPAHVAALTRTQAGALSLDECVTLEALEGLREGAALDPVRLLGLRFAYADGGLLSRVANGAPLPAAEVKLCQHRRSGMGQEMCACTSGVCESEAPPADGEVISVIAENRLVGLYGFDGRKDSWRSRCVFQKGVSRGVCL